jgi:hypothetical protein
LPAVSEGHFAAPVNAAGFDRRQSVASSNVRTLPKVSMSASGNFPAMMHIAQATRRALIFQITIISRPARQSRNLTAGSSFRADWN